MESCTSSTIKYWMQFPWYKSTHKHTSGFSKDKHRRSWSRMCLRSDKISLDWVALNLLMQLSLSNCPTHLCKNKVLNGLWWHLDVITSIRICCLIISLMHLLIYWRQHLKTFENYFFHRFGLSFQTIYYSHTQTQTIHVSLHKAFEHSSFMPYAFVLLIDVILKSPNHYNIHYWWLLKDFLCLSKTHS